MASGPIQNLTPGFLSLMQLKNLGRLPGKLEDNVSPSVDMEAWWLRGLLEADAASGTTTLAAGSFGFQNFATTPIVVPAGQWWYVKTFSVRTDALAAGESVFGLAPAVQWNPNAGTAIKYATLADPLPQILGPTSQAMVTARDFWLPPGAALGLFVFNTTGGAIDFTGDVYRSPIEI